MNIHFILHEKFEVPGAYLKWAQKRGHHISSTRVYEEEELPETVDDIDLFEINEAFAASSLAVNRELGLNESQVNIYGGAIALGHAIGSSGSKILTTLSYALKREQKRYGIASLCIGGGLGLAVLLKNPNL